MRDWDLGFVLTAPKAAEVSVWVCLCLESLFRGLAKPGDNQGSYRKTSPCLGEALLKTPRKASHELPTLGPGRFSNKSPTWDTTCRA